MSNNDTSSAISSTGDRRVRKTRSALKKALTTLMLTKNINSISVKELTDIADINRGTFYLHYKDVYDLLHQSEDELMQTLVETVNSFSAEALEHDPSALFKELYTICRQHHDVVNILISENGDIKFIRSLEMLLRDKCLRDWSITIKKSSMEHFDAYYAFIVGGVLSVIQYWFANGMAETPEELAKITSDFINQARSADKM